VHVIKKTPKNIQNGNTVNVLNTPNNNKNKNKISHKDTIL